MNIFEYIEKVNTKLNKRFPESGNYTHISFEFNNPFGVYELIIKINQKEKGKTGKKICSIAYIPDGLIDDDREQNIERRDFSESRDMIDYTFMSLSDNTINTITAVKKASMRFEKIYKDIIENGQYYNGILANYIDLTKKEDE